MDPGLGRIYHSEDALTSAPLVLPTITTVSRAALLPLTSDSVCQIVFLSPGDLSELPGSASLGYIKTRGGFVIVSALHCGGLLNEHARDLLRIFCVKPRIIECMDLTERSCSEEMDRETPPPLDLRGNINMMTCFCYSGDVMLRRLHLCC